MTGEGILAKLLKQRFAKACERFQLNTHGRHEVQRLNISQFAVPGRAMQGVLFG